MKTKLLPDSNLLCQVQAKGYDGRTIKIIWFMSSTCSLENIHEFTNVQQLCCRIHCIYSNRKRHLNLTVEYGGIEVGARDARPFSVQYLSFSCKIFGKKLAKETPTFVVDAPIGNSGSAVVKSIIFSKRSTPGNSSVCKY